MTRRPKPHRCTACQRPLTPADNRCPWDGARNPAHKPRPQATR
jgi:hypothetical protein